MLSNRGLLFEFQVFVGKFVSCKGVHRLAIWRKERHGECCRGTSRLKNSISKWRLNASCIAIEGMKALRYRCYPNSHCKPMRRLPFIAAILWPHKQCLSLGLFYGKQSPPYWLSSELEQHRSGLHPISWVDDTCKPNGEEARWDVRLVGPCWTLGLFFVWAL